MARAYFHNVGPIFLHSPWSRIYPFSHSSHLCAFTHVLHPYPHLLQVSPSTKYPSAQPHLPSASTKGAMHRVQLFSEVQVWQCLMWIEHSSHCYCFWKLPSWQMHLPWSLMNLAAVSQFTHYYWLMQSRQPTIHFSQLSSFTKKPFWHMHPPCPSSTQ